MEQIPERPGYTLLYKYRSFATEAHVGFAKDILFNHRLYAAAPESFNDPFDCAIRVSLDATPSEKITRAIKRIKEENPHITDEEARTRAPDRLKLLEKHGIDQLRSWVKKDVGVISLAEELQSPLLWAHYASGHTGIVIEFRMSALSDTGFFGQALQVKYYTEFPVFNFYRDPIKDQVNKFFLAKATNWEYEREWRILAIDRQQIKYFEFDPRLISAVYMGCRILPEHRDMVKNWLLSREVSPPPKLFQAKPSDTIFALEFEPVALS